MAWKESSVVEQRLQFVVLASQRQWSMVELCRQYGISRQTGYSWLKRYQQGGASQVVDRSRRPHRSPRRTPGCVEQAVVALRRRYPDWGAPKLHHLLREQHPEWELCEKTVHRILLRHHLVDPEDRRRPAVKRFQRNAPNELWQMDFKGPHGLKPGRGMGPLSILDDHSRYVVELRQIAGMQMAGVREVMEQRFVEDGLPEAMLMDHGTPWWNNASPWGISELSVWIMRQGVKLLFSGVRHPQTQGKVERMHAALQRAVSKRRPKVTDQAWLDQFRYEYNHLRPHEALEMASPASRWHPSERRYQPRPPEWIYPCGTEVVRLAGAGQLSWRGRRWEISNALRRQLVGVEVLEDRAIVYFCNTPMRELDLRTGASLPIPSTGFLQR